MKTSQEALPLSRKAKRILALARCEAGRLLHSAIEPEHFLLAILRQDDGTAADILRRHQVQFPRLRDDIERLLGPGSTDNIRIGLPFSLRSEQLLERAAQIQAQLHHDKIASDLILLAFVRENHSDLAALLLRNGINAHNVLEAVLAKYGIVQQASPIEILLLQALAKQGRLNTEVLQGILQREQNQPINQCLVDQGILSPEEVARLVARESGCETIDLSDFTPDIQLVRQFPADLARRLAVFPLRYEKDLDTLYIALADPLEREKLEEIRNLWGVNVIPLIAPEHILQKLLLDFFSEEPT